jgi:hypothetical protein
MGGVDQGGFPILDSGSWIPSAPNGVHDAGFTVQVEIHYKELTLQTEDTIWDAPDFAAS